MRRSIFPILWLLVSPLLHATPNSANAKPASSPLATATPAQTPAPSASPATANRELLARKVMLALANAFANDGFKTRDAYHFDHLAPKQPKLFRLPLVAPNAYWILAASESGTKIAVSVFDADGKPVKTDSFANDNAVAAGFHAEKNGGYILRIEETAGKAADFCLIYSYK